MKLRYSPTSPYVRKVCVVASEHGLDGRIERIPTDTRDPESDLSSVNPLGKVPALILDSGEAIVDSPVICEYLDSLPGGTPLIPAAGAARWTALRQQALADGILDAAILRLIETARRPEELRWPGWIELQHGKIMRTLDALETQAAALGGALTLGQIAIGCALGYLDFRFPADNWRVGRPGLAAWYEGFAKRPSMMASAPREG